MEAVSYFISGINDLLPLPPNGHLHKVNTILWFKNTAILKATLNLWEEDNSLWNYIKFLEQKADCVMDSHDYKNFHI